ncbi:MAG: hypothetical protein EXS08_02015 [Planctomycetes bacterium]|nr:hypothetical protein [Planctomycetota bacterium]
MLLAGWLSTSCALFVGNQAESLDLAALQANEGYVVGTFTTVEQYDDGTTVILLDAPEIHYQIDFVPVPPRLQLNPRIMVKAETGPAFFAVKLSAGPQRMERLSIVGGNATCYADVDHAVDVQPGGITYVGDIRFQIDSEQGWFGIHLCKALTTTVHEDRELLDRLMRMRFPGATPNVRIALARAETEATARPFELQMTPTAPVGGK